MNILSKEEVEIIYDEITSVIESKDELKEKLILLKRIFNHLFVEITSGEEIAFSNIQSRIDFVIVNNDVEEKTIQRLKRIKRFIYISINKRINFSKTKFEEFVSDLISAVDDILKEGLPEKLRIFAEAHKPEEKPDEIKDPDDYIDSIKCIILNVTSINQDIPEKEYFSIYCDGIEDDIRFSLRIYKYYFTDFYILQKNLRRYQTVRILDIKVSVKEKYFYISTNNTQIIIEPDFLIEASEIAECFSGFELNPNIYFVRKLIPSILGEGAFKGTLVNGLMDKLICDSNINPDEVLKELADDNPLRACAIGKEGIEKIFNDIKSTHYKNLLRLFKNKRTNKIKIEPTFLSPIYGIHGRLDALIIPEGKPENKNVFELKSGKPPKRKSIWLNNKMQLVCYEMLMKSTFGQERKGTNSILYSASNESSFRAVSVSLSDEKKVISVRNQIVAEIFRISENNFTILNKFLTSSIGTVPVFSIRDINEFSNLLTESSDAETKYYRYNLSFAIREYIISKIGNSKGSDSERKGFASLWTETLQEKEKDYNIISNLKLEEYKPSNDIVEFSIHEISDHNFRDNDFVIIYKRDGEYPNPLNTELYRGKIKIINTQKAEVELHNKQLDYNYFSAGSIWIMEHDIVESNIWSTIQTLYDFLRAPKTKKEILLGIKEPTFEENDYEFDIKLSKDQNENIQKAISAKDYYLMQGPPGAGKTSTALIGIIKNLIITNREADKKILVLAYTNRAVDEISFKLLENNIDFIKIGGKSTKEDYEISKVFKENTFSDFEESLKLKDVYVSTVSSFYSKMYDLKEIVDIDTIIIDEASQLTDYSIAGILCNFRKFIMIGDQNQLPAVITQDDESCIIKDRELNNLGIRNLNVSLFERLYIRCKKNGWSKAIGQLSTHYRLHEDISTLIENLYDNRLVTGKKEQSNSFNIYNKESENDIEKLLSTSRLIFIESDYEKLSKANYCEAIIVRKLLETIKHVYGNNFNEKTTGVVTPWRAQIALIKKQLEDEEILEKVTIDTVERFQGSEREVIINSYAIHNILQLKNLESFNTEGIDRKLLVSISRGSEQLILTGNRKVLEKGRYYKEIIKHIKKNGTIINTKSRKAIFKV